VGDISLLNGKINLAIECFKKSEDLGSLLLIYSSLGLKKELIELGLMAEKLTRMNIAFVSYYLARDIEKCIEVLIKSERFPEAAIFAKTYAPSKVT
jgi:coatomer subunit beta'